MMQGRGNTFAPFSAQFYIERIKADLAKIDAEHFPDFFILSPPRTGTTWLTQVLCAHPEIHIPPEKELRFFDVGWQHSSISFYASRFAAAGRVRGDASPTYVLLPQEIIREIHRIKPQLKFIVVLRDMAQRAWSNFNHSLAVGEFSMHNQVAAFGHIPVDIALDYLTCDYTLAVGNYAEYLPRWLNHFSPEQFFVTSMDEIETSSVALLRRIHSFLGVSPHDGGAELALSKINTSLGGKTPPAPVSKLMAALYGERQRHQDSFLRMRFACELRGNGDSEPCALFPLLTRADGFKILVHGGRFYACVEENSDALMRALADPLCPSPPHLAADYLSDLRGMIDRTKGAPYAKPEGSDGDRLMSILERLAEDYPSSISLRPNCNSVTFLREHGHFNLVAVAGHVVALRRSLGHVSLRGVDLTRLCVEHGTENVVIGHSVEEVVGVIERHYRPKPPQPAEQVFDENFLDCRLIRWNERCYAIPHALKDVKLSELPTNQLDHLPSAANENELRILLLLGHAEISQRLYSLNSLIGLLSGNTHSSDGFYWKDSSIPRITEEYNGFNIIIFNQLFIGLRQSIGAVDLSIGLGTLASTISADDMLICASVPALKIEIDGLSPQRRAPQIHMDKAAPREEGEKTE